MSKINLSDLSSFSPSVLNENFRKIESVLDDKVLFRDNPVGYPNQMESDLDMNGNDVLNVGTLHAKNVIADFVTDGDDFPIVGGLKDNEILKWDSSLGKLVGSGLMSDTSGEITTSNNSVNIGVHTIGSAGRNVLITNLVDNRHFASVDQELSILDSLNTGAMVRERGSLEEYQAVSDSSVIINNPAWQFTTLPTNQTVFSVTLWPAADMEGVWYELSEQGIPIFSDELGSFKANDNVTEIELKSPYDVYGNTQYSARLYRKDGKDCLFRGGQAGKPWYKIKLRPFTVKELATKEYVDNTSGSGMPSDYPQVKQQVEDNKNAIATHSTEILQNRTSISGLSADVVQLQNDALKGIHVEDVDNNAFDDITGLVFEGATVTDDGGSPIVHVKVKPKITVANGQGPSDTSADGNALIFTGATITVDQHDSNVLHITIPHDGGTGHTFSVVVDDTTYSTFSKLDFKDFTAVLNGDTLELTAPTVTPSAGIEIDNGTSNLAGVTKLNFPTSEFVAKSPTEVDITPYVTVVDKADNKSVLSEYITVQPPLKVFSDPDKQYSAEVYIDPTAYEAQHGRSCLVKLGSDLYVKGGKEVPVYCDAEIVPFGEYFSPNVAAHGINVQDTTGDDPSVTGGQLTEILASVGFFDVAPEDGTVKVWLEYKDPLKPLAPKILEDVNGVPLIFERAYKQDEPLGDIVVYGGMLATGLAPVVLKVETSFQQSSIVVIDPDKTMIGINQFSDGYETSLARIEFQRRLGISIIPVMYNFTKEVASLAKAINGVSLAEDVIPAGAGLDSVNSFGIKNLTEIKAAIGSDTISIKDNGTPADFYFDYILDGDRTAMARGKEFSATVKIKNPNSAFVVAMYSWSGKADHHTQLYKSRNNDALVLETGWTLVKSASIPELASGDSQAVTLMGTIPEEATNVGFFVYPLIAQSPTTLTIEDVIVGSETDFTGYVDKVYSNLHEEHLRFDKRYAEFTLHNGGLYGLRYTINDTPDGNPMPVGQLTKGKLDVEVDNTINQVAGSADPQNDGAIKFNADGQAIISHTYRVCNETGTDTVVKFWDVLFDVDGNPTKLGESERTFSVKANTKYPGVVLTVPAYTVEVEKGQRIGGRASADKNDGAFIESMSASDLMVQTVVEFDELVTGGSDDPWGDLDLSQFDAVYSNMLTATKDVFNVNSVALRVDIPDTDHLVVLGAVKELSDLSVRPVSKLDWVYNNSDKTLRVSFGETVLAGRVTIGVFRV